MTVWLGSPITWNGRIIDVRDPRWHILTDEQRREIVEWASACSGGRHGVQRARIYRSWLRGGRLVVRLSGIVKVLDERGRLVTQVDRVHLPPDVLRWSKTYRVTTPLPNWWLP